MSRVFAGFTAIAVVLCTAIPARADEREAAYQQLVADFDAARARYSAVPRDPNATPAEQIQRYEAYPLWEFLPKFVAAAEAQPDDAVALDACQWIIDACGSVGTGEASMFAAEAKAWGILADHHADDPQLPLLCLHASIYLSPSRERFLREIATRADLPDTTRAVAQLALAEFLTKRYELAEGRRLEPPTEPTDEVDRQFRARLAPEWLAYAAASNAAALRVEAIGMYRGVLAQYANVPFTLTAPGFRDLATIGQKARKSLYALEHLVVGALAPEFDAVDLEGNPVRLADYRGQVVLLSFWFTGCGPCVALVPEEQKLVEQLADQPFALIGVTKDADLEMAKKTVADLGMTWPSIDDGKSLGERAGERLGELVDAAVGNRPDERPTSVTELYNVLSWPTLYLIDAEGRIVSKDVPRDGIAEAIEAALQKQSHTSGHLPDAAE
jgi:peroxiredoxin